MSTLKQVFIYRLTETCFMNTSDCLEIYRFNSYHTICSDYKSGDVTFLIRDDMMAVSFPESGIRPDLQAKRI